MVVKRFDRIDLVKSQNCGGQEKRQNELIALASIPICLEKILSKKLRGKNVLRKHEKV